MQLQKKTLLVKLKGYPNLFVTNEFFYSQYRNEDENIEGTEDPFVTDKFSLKACSL